MTNADKFKQERIEDLKDEIKRLENHSPDYIEGLAEYIKNNVNVDFCNYCIYNPQCNWDNECERGIRIYLEQEVKDE